jgi:uracil-DNA glycosylase
MLWGNHAKSKATFITNNHLVLSTSHPSPLGAYRGFNGCGHFKAANDYLERVNKNVIRWQT